MSAAPRVGAMRAEIITHGIIKPLLMMQICCPGIAAGAITLACDLDDCDPERMFESLHEALSRELTKYN